MSDRTEGSGELCAALPGCGGMLRRLLGSKRTLLLGMNTRVQENSQNGELKVGPSPRQPGPWTIPSGREGGVHPGMYHWLPHHCLCVWFPKSTEEARGKTLTGTPCGEASPCRQAEATGQVSPRSCGPQGSASVYSLCAMGWQR